MADFAFVSYSQRKKKDRVYVEKLHSHLQLVGVKAWYDKGLPHGVAWSDELNKQIEDCAALVLVITKRSIESEWCQKEVRLAEKLGKKIFPLHLSGDPPSEWQKWQMHRLNGWALPGREWVADLGNELGVTVTPDAWDAPERAREYVGRARKLMLAGRTKEAHESALLAVVEAPGLADAQNTLGITFYLLGETDEAIAAYERAIEIDPNHEWAFRNLGQVYVDLGRFWDAITALERALVIKPDDGITWVHLARAQKGIGKVAEADRSARRAVELDSVLEEGVIEFGLYSAHGSRPNDPIEDFPTFMQDALPVHLRRDQSGTVSPTDADSAAEVWAHLVRRYPDLPTEMQEHWRARIVDIMSRSSQEDDSD